MKERLGKTQKKKKTETKGEAAAVRQPSITIVFIFQ
jgi:hypothetical protein